MVSKKPGVGSPGSRSSQSSVPKPFLGKTHFCWGRGVSAQPVLMKLLGVLEVYINLGSLKPISLEVLLFVFVGMVLQAERTVV